MQILNKRVKRAIELQNMVNFTNAPKKVYLDDIKKDPEESNIFSEIC